MHLFGACVGGLILIGYPIGAHLLMRWVQPRRLRLGRLGSTILARDDVSPELKKLVISMLGDAYSPSFMAKMVFELPLVGLRSLFRRGRRSSSPFGESHDVRKVFYEFSDCHMLATSVANPGCAIIVALEMALLTMVLFPFGRLRQSTDVQIDAVVGAESRDGVGIWQTMASAHR